MDEPPEPRPAGASEATTNGRESWLDRLIGRLSPKREEVRAEIEAALRAAAAESLRARERTMLANVLDFHQLRVDDVMVPRADIVAVPVGATLSEILGVFRTAGHSRLPAFGTTLDEPLGMVHIRDFLEHLVPVPSEAASPEGAPSLTLRDPAGTLDQAAILRPVLFVPRSMPAIDLLVRMQASRTHMALVVDEFGGTDGLVSLEDLVERVVGDIEDEHDESVPLLTVEPDGALLADARVDLAEVSEIAGAALGTDEDIDTLGGLIVALAGRVPHPGEIVAGPSGLAFEVLEADPRRLRRVRIRRREPVSGIDAAGAAA